jgi:hypothetical protein
MLATRFSKICNKTFILVCSHYSAANSCLKKRIYFKRKGTAPPLKESVSWYNFIRYCYNRQWLNSSSLPAHSANKRTSPQKECWSIEFLKYILLMLLASIIEVLTCNTCSNCSGLVCRNNVMMRHNSSSLTDTHKQHQQHFAFSHSQGSQAHSHIDLCKFEVNSYRFTVFPTI